jgi:hypothetical protein
MAPNQLAELKT